MGGPAIGRETFYGTDICIVKKFLSSALRFAFFYFLVDLQALRNGVFFLSFLHIKKDFDNVSSSSLPSKDWGQPVLAGIPCRQPESAGVEKARK